VRVSAMVEPAIAERGVAARAVTEEFDA